MANKLMKFEISQITDPSFLAPFFSAGSDYNYDAAPAPAEYDDAAYADYEEEAQPTYEGESAAPSYGVPEEAAPTEAPLNSYEAERGARAFRGNNRNNRNRSQGRRQGRRNNGRR